MPEEIRMNIVKTTIIDMIQSQGYKDRDEAREHLGALYAKKYITLEEFNEISDMIEVSYPILPDENFIY